MSLLKLAHDTLNQCFGSSSDSCGSSSGSRPKSQCRYGFRVPVECGSGSRPLCNGSFIDINYEYIDILSSYSTRVDFMQLSSKKLREVYVIIKGFGSGSAFRMRIRTQEAGWMRIRIRNTAQNKCGNPLPVYEPYDNYLRAVDLFIVHRPRKYCSYIFILYTGFVLSRLTQRRTLRKLIF
jgi:hypothetical protein